MVALYDCEDFTESDSEMSFMKRLERKRKRRWEDLRKEADLTTVKESQGEYMTSYYRGGNSLVSLKRQQDYGDRFPELFKQKQDLSVVSADDADDIQPKPDRDKTEGILP